MDTFDAVARSGSLCGPRHTKRLLVVCTFAAILAVLAFGAIPAAAVTTRVPLSSSPITGFGTGTSLVIPSGIDVDESSGNVVVNDIGEGAKRLDVFGPEGGLPAGVGAPYQVPGVESNLFKVYPAAGVAIDNSPTSPSQGTVYVTETLPPGTSPTEYRLRKFTLNPLTEEYEAAGELIPSAPFNDFRGVEVDGEGNVWVADFGNNVIFKFSPTGAQLQRLKLPITCFPGEPCAPRPSDIAVDGSGNVFTAGLTNGGAGGGVAKYTPNASGELEPKVFTTFPFPIYNTGIAIDRATNTLYVAKGDSYDGSNTTGTTGNRIVTFDTVTLAEGPEFGRGTLSDTTRIAVNSATGNVYVGDEGPGKSIAIFSPEVKVLAGVANGAATAIKTTKATLNATVNPDSLAVTECVFEYGPTTEYGQMAPCEGAIPADSSDHAVSADLSNLEADTTYHYRLLATNANGTNQSADRSFKTNSTPFLVETKPASAVAGTKATLNGVVQPKGVTITECVFEYGTTTAYGSSVPCEGAIPADEEEHAVSASITGLVPNDTIYHFRIVATGIGEEGAEEVLGKDQSFQTADTVITGGASAITDTTATLGGSINPEGTPLTECSFEYGPSAAYGSSVPCQQTPAEIGSGTSPVAVDADITGLQAGEEIHFRLSATNAQGTVKGLDKAFKTLGPPEILEQKPLGVGLNEATLRAKVNPEGFPTTYRIEYGTDTSYGQNTPEAEVGDDRAEHTVSRFIAGLSPNTAYHWRVVATNHCHSGEPAVACVTEGPDSTFKTFPEPVLRSDCLNQPLRTGLPSAHLPDCRAYEMVSPTDKNGADAIAPDNIAIYPEEEAFYRASPDGTKVSYASAAAFADAKAGPFSIAYVASRNASGWSSHSITPPQGTNISIDTPAYPWNHLLALSEDLSMAWHYTDSDPPLHPEGVPGYRNLYRADTTTDAQTPLTTVTPPTIDPGQTYKPWLAGFSADGKTTVFAANDRLHPEATDTDAFQVYEHREGVGLRLVSRLPGGTASGLPSFPGGGLNSLEGAVSADGSRIYWTTGTQLIIPNVSLVEGGETVGRIYLREDGTTTIPVSDTAPGDGPARFWIGATDGSGALFTKEGKLYRFERETEASSEIATGVKGVGGASEDLSRAYFVSTNVLDAQPNSEGDTATAAKENLYLYDQATGIRFVATVDKGGFRIYKAGNNGVASRIGRVSPDADALLFTAYEPLTGFDSTIDGEGYMEAFRYSAVQDQLDCVSCNPSGAEVLGRENEISRKELISAFFPGVRQGPYYQQRALSDDGNRAYFQSFDRLVGTDTNDRMDVYQWQAPGTGECTLASVGFSGNAGGCLSLISTGKSDADSHFVEATPDGETVFFRTLEPLVSQDKDNLFDIYAARVGGGIAAQNPPPDPAACEGEACRGTSPPDPGNAGAGSAVFSGPGDKPQGKKACPKGKRKVTRRGKTRCLARKPRKARNGNKARRKAGHERRAGR